MRGHYGAREAMLACARLQTLLANHGVDHDIANFVLMLVAASNRELSSAMLEPADSCQLMPALEIVTATWALKYA